MIKVRLARLKPEMCPIFSSFMITLAEARRLVAEHVRPRPAVETPLEGALGRVLAASVIADADYPAGDLAQMDGYVVRADAQPGVFRVAGTVAAGAVPVEAVRPGEAFRIFTGALLPPGGGRVIKQEDVRREGPLVVAEDFSGPAFIRAQGSEARRGAVVLPAGTRLGAAELAVLAQVGAVRPLVVDTPVVRHVATGSELVDPSATPGPGFIRDTNSTLLRSLLAEAGVTSFTTTRVADDEDALAAAAETDAGLLLISGGASVGDYDFGASVLRRLGYTIHFDRLSQRPGKPLTFATRGEQAAFVIPGNPVSHFVSYHTVVRLAVELASGLPPAWPLAWLDLRGGEPLTSDPRDTWWPAHVSVAEGKLAAAPRRWMGSGDSFALAGANALVLVNADSPAQGRALTLLLAPPAA